MTDDGCRVLEVVAQLIFKFNSNRNINKIKSGHFDTNSARAEFTQ